MYLVTVVETPGGTPGEHVLLELAIFLLAAVHDGSHGTGGLALPVDMKECSPLSVADLSRVLCSAVDVAIPVVLGDVAESVPSRIVK